MKFEPDKHLHSREHLLADDLSREMAEPKRFAAYLGVAKMYYEGDLRALAKRVLAKPDLDPKNRGRYFFGALKGLPKSASWLKELRARRRRRKSKSRKDRGSKSHLKSRVSSSRAPEGSVAI